MRNRLRALHADERGTTLILMSFFTALALAVVLVVTAATSLYLERKRLFSLADGAALVGAEAFRLTDVRIVGDSVAVDLDSAAVHDAVSDYLEQAPHTFEALHLERAASDDGRSATVQLSAMWRPPVLTLFVPEGLRLDVTAIARSVFQ